MRLFTCQVCGQVLYFENTACERCGHRLGYLPERFALRALEADGYGWREAGSAQAGALRFCANTAHEACNWMLGAGEPGPFCAACRHNRTVPDLDVAENLPRWRVLEAAKHRLFYGLMRLRLPLVARADDGTHGLAFDFLAETPAQPQVITGHAGGIVTIALKEGDPTERERMRTQMGELYRTPLGHFRHEVGHHYWDLLVAPTAALAPFRALFGDERADYAAALQAHYDRADDGAWRDGFVSLYARAHPWEDFAETFAHYLHIVDTLETATAFGLRVNPGVSRDPSLTAAADFDPYGAATLDDIVQTWLPIVFAVNSLNRAMGQPDLYPFTLAPKVLEKLGFVHALLRDAGRQAPDTRRTTSSAAAGMSGRVR